MAKDEFDTPDWADGEAEAFFRCQMTWHRKFVLCTKLDNGEVVWCKNIYEGRFMNDAVEQIDEAEYIMRKLAGTLSPEYNPDDWK